MLITKTDPYTDEENTLDLDITQEHLDKWKGGELIQDVMPHLTPDEREFLITGLTPESWEETMGVYQKKTKNNTKLKKGPSLIGEILLYLFWFLPFE